MDSDENEALQEPEHVVIFTARLRLRTLRVADAVRAMPILSHADVMKWTTQRPMTTVSQAERWLKDRSLGRDVFNFALELRDSDDASASRPDLVGIMGSFEWPKVGYLIHPDHAGKGYATEALHALVPALFERMPCASVAQTGGFDYVEAETDVGNWASRRVLEKCGFVMCGQFEESGRDGERVEVVIWRKARPGSMWEARGFRDEVEEVGGWRPPVL